MRDDFLHVKAGDPISASKWNQMRRAANASQVLLGGENVRVSRFPHGTLIDAKYGGGFSHPWRVLATSTFAQVAPGTVNGQFPLIIDHFTGESVPINFSPAPALDLSAPQIGPNNIGWIALQLHLSEDYRTIKTAYVVQAAYIVGSETATNNPFFFFGLPGIGNFRVRYPLARIQQRGANFDIYQVSMFNLNHTAKPPSPAGSGGSQLPRHFFWPT